MRARTAAFILLACLVSGDTLAAPGRARLTYLFGDYVVRPPRAIPHARLPGRSAMATVPPLPRARPAAAPEAGKVSERAPASGPPSAGRAPEGHAGAAAFPPVVTLE